MRKPGHTLCLAIFAASLGAVACGVASREPVAEFVAGSGALTLAPAGFSDVDLELRPLRPLEDGSEPILFVHLVDAERRVVRTFDRPLGGDWPVSGSIRETIRIHLSALVDPPPPGEYALTAGLYDLLLGRFALATERPAVGKLEYEIGRVRVTSPRASAARLEFAHGWRDAEDVPDLQVIRLRSLEPRQDGEALLAPLGGPTELWMLVGLPRPSLADRLEIVGDGERARLRVSSPCASTSMVVEGPGSHEVSMHLAPGESGRCELRFEANHFVRADLVGRAETPTLEAAAWQPR